PAFDPSWRVLMSNDYPKGRPDHKTPLYQSPRWGNDEEMLHDRGIWGSMATWQDSQGKRFLIMPMQGPPSKGAPKFKCSYGNAEQGSVMAFEVRTDPEKGRPMLDPVWISRDGFLSEQL